jgi:predicted RNA-binding Zn ribbon-like protein
MVSMKPDPQAAPGNLETVRQLLNSWYIPHEPGEPVEEPVDAFDAHTKTLKFTDTTEALQLRQLRDDLRAVVERVPNADLRLNTWLKRLKLRPVIQDGAVRFHHEAGVPGDMLALVLSAIQEGSWDRLKACPDCHWVFFDHSRNGSKRWCLMTAAAGGPGGRSCGSIAKVKRYRAKHKQS